MGLELVDSVINAKTEYSELIVVELRKDGKKFRVAGTIIGQTPRIVEIDRLFVDTNIKGHFLIVRNDDRPGIVGLVGTALGDAGLNIANLSLARNQSVGVALNVIELDSAPDAEFIAKMAAQPGVLSVTAIEI